MGALDMFLNAIKVNDIQDDDYLDDDGFLDDEEGFLDDEPENKPRRKFLDRFSSSKKETKRRSVEEDEDDLLDLDDLDDLEAKEPAVTPSRKPVKLAAPKVKETPSRVEKSSGRSSASKVTPMRDTARRTVGAAGNVEVCVYRPTSMENTREIADTLLDNATVILNLEGLDVDLAQRIIDFTSGACYALDGSLHKVSSFIFVLGPANVVVNGDLQNIMSGAMPSVRAGY